MALQTLRQVQQPVPLTLHRAQVDLDEFAGRVALVDESGALVVDIVELLLVDFDLVQKLKR